MSLASPEVNSGINIVDENIFCPACGRTLEQLQIEEVTIDVCTQGCGGIWLDNFELRKVTVKKPFAIEQKSGGAAFANQKLKCPRCRKTGMHRQMPFPDAGVLVDCCPRCNGVWLDSGELEQLKKNRQSASPEISSDRAVRKKVSDRLVISHRTQRAINLFNFLWDTVRGVDGASVSEPLEPERTGAQRSRAPESPGSKPARSK